MMDNSCHYSLRSPNIFLPCSPDHQRPVASAQSGKYASSETLMPPPPHGQQNHNNQNNHQVSELRGIDWRDYPALWGPVILTRVGRPIPVQEITAPNWFPGFFSVLGFLIMKSWFLRNWLNSWDEYVLCSQLVPPWKYEVSLSNRWYSKVEVIHPQ